MSGSARSSFGAAPVGSSVQPCPLGTIDVEVVRSDGLTPSKDIRVILVGPEALEGTVPGHEGGWRSPKIRPGVYSIELDRASIPGGWQTPEPASCHLPASGTATARLVLQPAASLPIRVVRKGTTTAIEQVTVALSQSGHKVEATTTLDGSCRLVDLPTTQPGYRIDLTLTTSERNRYQPWSPRDITLVPGPNPSLQLELAPLAEITVKVVDPDSTNRRTVPATVTLTREGGEPVVLDTDPTTDLAVFVGLEGGSYAITATPGPTSACASIADGAVTIEPGATRTVELLAARARSRIVMSDKATRQEARGLLKDLLIKRYAQARDELAATPVRNTTVLLPFSNLPFDDILFEPDDGYWDDAKEAIAVSGWAEAHGVRRQILFAHTYRPNRLILAVKAKEWEFDRHWLRKMRGPITTHVKMEEAFVVLSATETSIKSGDLPAGVSGFFDREELDLKQGVNLYGKFDTKGFPALESLLTWMGVDERFVKLEGYLGREADFAFSKESIEKGEVAEKAWELALSGTIPWRIPPALPFIKERELTLEIAANREVKGFGKIIQKTGSMAREMVTGTAGTVTPQKIEKKVHLKIEDAIKIPLPTLSIPWLVVANEEKDVEFTGSFQIEHELKSSGSGETGSGTGTEGSGPEFTLEYGTDFKIALFGEQLAIHDFKAELNLSEGKLKLAGEIDLGRREKVAVVEFERDVGTKKPAGEKPATGAPPTVEAGPSTPPKPGLNLEEKQNKPQPEAPTEEELAAATKASSSSSSTTRKESPWSVTVKLKPSVVMGLVDIVRDIADHIAAQRAKP